MNTSRTPIRHLAIAIAIALAIVPHAARATPGTFYVDNSGEVACSNNGPGTEAQPFCTITAAVTKVGGPGCTIIVKTGTYREQVTIPVSGAPGDSFVIRAIGPVTIDGADSFEQPGLWTQFSGDVWLTPIGWSPVQVLVNGALLLSSTDDPALLQPNNWRYVPGQGLYVNANGGNPGLQGIHVGHRLDGFHINGKSYISIRDFLIIAQDEKGIELEGGASNIELLNNYVNLCASSGISLHSCADVMIRGNYIVRNAFHGIELSGGSTGCQILNNVSSWNMDRFSAIATGIYLNGSPDNTIENNKVFHNGDTGIEIQGGSDNCLSIQNVSFENADHGFYHLGVVGTVNIGNVAWKNATDGISIQGGSQNTSIYNCIATDNALPTGGWDFLADTSSSAGMESDYNLFWNSTTQKPIKYRGVQYATVAAYSAASGLDNHTLQADPMFFDPENGLFHLTDGSPAIDSGTSGILHWPDTDAQGLPREDDPAAPNTGAGGVTYADRGAFEHRVSAVGVGDPTLPPRVSLSSAYPNPAAGAVAFALSLPRASQVEWGVYDLAGRKLAGGTAWHPAGRSVVSWSEAKGGPAGVRFARFTIEGERLQRRFVTVR